MKNFLYLAIIFHSQIYAVLDEVRVLTDSERTVIIFSDDHTDFPKSDARQLEYFIQALTDRNKKNMRPLHVLIEEPIALFKLLREPRVTSSLGKTIEEQSLAIDHENLEIRQATIIAEIMCLSKNPESIHPEGGDRYGFGEVTFVDIFNEFFYHFNRLQKQREFLLAHIGWSGHSLLLNEIFVSHNVLLSTLRYLNMRPDEPILNILKRFYALQQVPCADGKNMGYQNICKLLLKRMLEFSSALFDLHTVNRIFMQPKTDDIMLIAGGGHCSPISGALLGWINHSPFEQALRTEMPVKTCDASEDNGGIGLSNKSIARAIFYQPFSWKKIIAQAIALSKHIILITRRKIDCCRQKLNATTGLIKKNAALIKISNFFKKRACVQMQLPSSLKETTPARLKNCMPVM